MHVLLLDEMEEIIQTDRLSHDRWSVRLDGTTAKSPDMMLVSEVFDLSRCRK